MSEIPKIVIIGAGASGLAAAVKLLENGLTDLTILEAEDTIGGRIKSVEFGDSFIDLGAQWCHGEENNIVYELTHNLDLLGPSINTYTDHVFYQCGKKLDKELFDIFYKFAFEVMGNDEIYKDLEEPFGVNFEKLCKLEPLFEGHPFLCYLNDFIDWFHSFILCYKAAPSWCNVSVTNNEYEKCPGNPLLQWKGKGYKIFLDVLLKKYPDDSEKIDIDDKILFNKEVCCVHYDNKNAEFEVEIHCTDKTVYQANHVICTVPLGSLKEFHSCLFDPCLPNRKINAIEGLGFGVVSKIFLKFNKKWWPDETKGYSLLWNNKMREKLRRDFSQYVKKDGKTWLEGIFGFYVVDENPTVLQGWITGCRAGDIEKLKDQEILDACTYVLQEFIGSSTKIPFPEKVIVSKWNSNPNFLGTWSYRSMDTQLRQTCALHLSEPVRKNGKNVLLFAGEATHPYYFSTVHGAVESGFREADRIIAAYESIIKSTKSSIKSDEVVVEETE